MSLTLALFLIAWAFIGVVTGLWMIRRGHDPMWLVIAVALGPLFVPIAWERVERRPRLAASGPEGILGRAETRGPRVLVAMDGSPESDRALDTALTLFGSGCGMLVLAEVVCYDATDDATHAAIDAADARLAAAAERARAAGMPVRFEVLAGPPGETLRRFATDQDMDVLIVGRRGRGLSTRLLGSVSTELVHHAALPVLVVEPTRLRAPESNATVSARSGRG
ncbi:universal stress protein UspG [Nocardia otitidiscaviarum]|uniref:Universal stress protein UspG n=1 Tax=Nocardia otitidiscaviarum TaxID=1823 RepID=A0A378YS80_9NOCA|nr:universal stress protein [Nocardia otitidiscaviarum]SUA79377.1 universal stress protein UspG [Nocardia otitidiscaviarum]